METKTLNIDKITEKAKELQQQILNINAYRKTWSDTTKDNIYNTLNSICDQLKRIFITKIQIFDHVKNLEMVSITINETCPSGIIETKQISSHRRETIHYTKFGGSLVYQQLHNGKVAVYITYPYIENWVDQKQKFEIDSYIPSEITDEKIAEHLDVFLDELIKWEMYP